MNSSRATIGFIMKLCEEEPAIVGGMLRSAMPRTVNAKIAHAAESVPYLEARERLISRGIDPRLLETLPYMTDQEAEERRRRAENEAQAARVAEMNGDTYEPAPEGRIIEITE
jgi:hypothetical protein